MPAGQSLQTPAPAREYFPVGHWLAVALVDPAGHAYPAVHAPTHWSVVWAAALPYRPAAQLPVHADVISPTVEPNRPATQLVQDPDPATEYLPAGHWLAVADVDPMGQAYPAVHAPLHVEDVSPAVAPY